jgi:hypothetical protein
MKIRLRDIECRFSQNRYEIVKWFTKQILRIRTKDDR